jgi:hypothetical protein
MHHLSLRRNLHLTDGNITFPIRIDQTVTLQPR